MNESATRRVHSPVAIVGAGIAGLTLALALDRAGIRCRVFEQAPALGEVGAGIQLAPNATRVLRNLGLGAALREVAVRPEAVEMRRWDDARVLARTELGEDCERAYDAPYYVLYRPDLQRSLFDALPPDTLVLGRRLESVEERAGDVLLRFADGTQATAELCVGADGIHSAVREALVADRPRFSGQSIYRGVVPAERVPFLLEQPRVMIWLGPGRHFVHYPVAAGRLISFAATTPAEGWPTELTESWSASATHAELATAYEGWHEDVARVVAAAGAVNRWALHDRDTDGGRRTARIALIGDAAHPMLPFLAQGANQAIEDAGVLARCLLDIAEVPDALERYAKTRRGRVERVHEISRRNAVMLHLDDGERQSERDAGLSAAQRLEEQQWLYGYDAMEAQPA